MIHRWLLRYNYSACGGRCHDQCGTHSGSPQLHRVIIQSNKTNKNSNVNGSLDCRECSKVTPVTITRPFFSCDSMSFALRTWKIRPETSQWKWHMTASYYRLELTALDYSCILWYLTSHTCKFYAQMPHSAPFRHNSQSAKIYSMELSKSARHA